MAAGLSEVLPESKSRSLSTEAVTALSAAATAAGRPEAGNALMVGYPGMEEFETAVAVWTTIDCCKRS